MTGVLTNFPEPPFLFKIQIVPKYASLVVVIYHKRKEKITY